MEILQLNVKLTHMCIYMQYFNYQWTNILLLKETETT